MHPRKDPEDFILLGVLLIGRAVLVILTTLESYVTLALFFSLLVLVNGFGTLYFCLEN